MCPVTPTFQPLLPTSTLPPQKLCDARGWATARIDGGTDVNKRQDVVNAFNSYGVGQASCFKRLVLRCTALYIFNGHTSVSGGGQVKHDSSAAPAHPAH